MWLAPLKYSSTLILFTLLSTCDWGQSECHFSVMLPPRVILVTVASLPEFCSLFKWFVHLSVIAAVAVVIFASLDGTVCGSGWCELICSVKWLWCVCKPASGRENEMMNLFNMQKPSKHEQPGASSLSFTAIIVEMSCTNRQEWGHVNNPLTDKNLEWGCDFENKVPFMH